VEDLGEDLDETPELKRRMATLVEDIAAIEARAQKELAFAAADPETRGKHAAISADYYQSIYDAVGGTYAGINAAMMARIAGDGDRSAKIAQKVVRQIGREPEGYWANATLGEAHLLTGDTGAATDAFVAAHRQADATDGHRSSTRVQLERIGAHLGIPTEAAIAALPVGSTAVYSGPLFRGAVLDDAAQQRLEGATRGAVDNALAAEGVRYIYGALACGADIVVAEAALAAGIELHVVLPFPVDAFVATSVEIGNPADAPDRWTGRFWQCLRQSASFTALVERPPETRQLDAHYFHAFKLAAGLALLRADALSSHAVMIAIDDGREPGSLAGAQTAAADWAAAGGRLVPIPIAMDRPKGGAQPQTDTFRPVVFAWPVNEPLDVAALALAAGKACGVRADPLPRSSRDRRTGVAIAVDTVGEALDLLKAVAERAAKAPHPVRIIADFGPATDAKGAANDALISRLTGASDMIGLPASVAIATLSFAARTRAEPGNRAGFIPIGRTASTATDKSGDGDGRPLPSRDVYAVSFPATPANIARQAKR
jgi:hypothetical protein